MTDLTAPGKPPARRTRSHAPLASVPTRLCHPLLGVLSLAAMALATFLVTFAVMLARSGAGPGPAQPGAAATVALSSGARRTVSARASGGASAVSPAPAAAAGVAAGVAPVRIAAAATTRSSGTAATAEGHDG